MSYDFHGKRALVTGAGQGIGRTIALELAKNGAIVFALSRTQCHLETLMKENPNIKTINVDVSNWDATRSAVQKILPIQLLVNNAGTNIPETIFNLKQESLDYIMNVNFKAVINVSQIIVNDLVSRNESGSIVNVSSIASTLAFNEHTVYSGTKAAVDMASKVMAMELGSSKIRVNCVNPTVILTTLAKKFWIDEKINQLLQTIPLNRIGKVEDVAECVLFLLSDNADFLTGLNLPVDGGMSFVGTQVPPKAI